MVSEPQAQAQAQAQDAGREARGARREAQGARREAQGAGREAPGARIALGLVVIASASFALWRLSLVGLGPDPDSDSYGHHAIARQILVEPRDLSVHWVWLPLFHYVQALLVAFGATLQTMRIVNVALWAAVPVLLFVVLARPRERDADGARARATDPTAFIAALFAIVSPIGMQMGTTAQPEPLFALAVLGFVFAIDRARFVLAGALLACAVLLRYEAWSILPVAFAWLVIRASRAKRIARAELAVVVLPALGLLAWAVARRVNDGAWLAFLAGTRDFANDAMREKTSLDAGADKLREDLGYYAWDVPLKMMGPAIALAAAGIARTVRRHGWMFVATFGACLGFVTLSWILRSSLGLYRHFVVLVPLYATLAANGAVSLGELAVAIARALRVRARAESWVFGVVNAAPAVWALWIVWGLLGTWMEHWRWAIEHPWPDRVAMGAFLRALPDAPTIVCDESTVEILSGIDRHRFDRHWVDEPGGALRIEALAREKGVVYVATWSRKLKDLREAHVGEIVYRPPGEMADDKGFAVLRVAKRD